MKAYSSTTLKLFTSYCPAALGFHEKHEPAFNNHFQAGIAAHAVLQVVGEKHATNQADIKSVADAVTEELITNGRAFKGTPEPPMDPAAAIEGRDLALAWLSWNELPEGQHERWMGMGPKGEQMIAGPCRYDAIVDMVYQEQAGGEDWEADTVVVRDYKTAWSAGRDELDTLQRKGQAVLAWLHYPDVKGITREVVNLRTGMTYRDTTWLDDEGVALMEQWREDILMLCRAADQTREPRPGLNCCGCQYILRCDAGRELLDPVQLPADLYGSAKGILSGIEPVLRRSTKEAPALDTFGNCIGYQKAERRKPAAGAVDQIVTLWCSDAQSRSEAAGLLQAMGGLGVSHITSVAKVLYPGKEDRDARDDLVDLCTEVESYAKFTTWKGGSDVDTDT